MSKMALQSKIEQAIPDLERFKEMNSLLDISKIWLSSKMKIWLSPRFACTFFFGGGSSDEPPPKKKVQANRGLRKIFENEEGASECPGMGTVIK